MIDGEHKVAFNKMAIDLIDVKKKLEVAERGLSEIASLNHSWAVCGIAKETLAEIEKVS